MSPPDSSSPALLAMKAKTCDENEINYYRTSSDCSCRGSSLCSDKTGVCGSPIGITTGAGRSGRKATSEWTKSDICENRSYPSFRLVNSLSS